VNSYNFRAIKLYKKAGFELHENHILATERVMILKL